MAKTHIPIEGSKRALAPGAWAKGRVNSLATIEISLKLRRKRPLPQLVGRPEKIMTHQELGAFGASPRDITKVVEVLEGFGLRLSYSNKFTRTLRFTATAAEMEASFQIRLFIYSDSDGS